MEVPVEEDESAREKCLSEKKRKRNKWKIRDGRPKRVEIFVRWVVGVKWGRWEHVVQKKSKKRKRNKWKIRVGVSNQTRYPTHPPNPADPARKPADPTPVTVGGKFPIPKSEFGGSVDGLKHGKPISTDPTGKHTGKAFSVDWSSSPVRFCPICRDPARSRRDLTESLQDRAWSCWDQPRSLRNPVRSSKNKQISAKIRRDSYNPSPSGKLWRSTTWTVAVGRSAMDPFLGDPK